jgi:hypothetical protein
VWFFCVDDSYDHAYVYHFIIILKFDILDRLIFFWLNQRPERLRPVLVSSLSDNLMLSTIFIFMLTNTIPTRKKPDQINLEKNFQKIPKNSQSVVDCLQDW